VSLFKKLRAVTFLVRKNGSGAVFVTPDTPTDDECRIAYELVNEGFDRPYSSRSHAIRDVEIVIKQLSRVVATLRKLGAA
jgi:hypothetical protein